MTAQLRFEIDGWEWPDVDDDDDTDTELTPPELIEPIRDFMGGEIHVDPCAHRCGHVRAICEYRKGDNGLVRPWVNIDGYDAPMANAFVNHPYSAGQPAKWLQRCHDVVAAHPQFSIVALSKCDTSTLWWKRWIWNSAAAVCFISRRIAFEKPTPEGRTRRESAKWASVLTYYGPHAAGFCEWFAELGGCVELAKVRR